MSILVKICGITNVRDALAAVSAGADVIGFVFADSPRRIDPEKAVEITAALPVGTLKAGVFVDEDSGVVKSIAEDCELDLLQFHGNETPEYCALFGDKAIKAMRVKDDSSLCDLGKYQVRAILLDAYVSGRPGGTGQTFDWALAARASEETKIILSGGLCPENVGAAIRAVRPVMVDVSSGVESSPGVKDLEKMRAFIKNAKKEQM